MWIGREPYRHAFLLDAADDRGLIDSSSTWQGDSTQPHCHFISESMYQAMFNARRPVISLAVPDGPFFGSQRYL
jgi:hypothetical protein